MTSKKNKMNQDMRDADLGRVSPNNRKGSRAYKLNVRVNKEKNLKKNYNERVIEGKEFIEGFEEKVETYVENYVEKIERTKKITLISGVSFFMLLIFSFYFYSFKVQITNISSDDNKNESIIGINLDQVKNDIGSLISDYNEVKEVISTEINEDSNGQEDLSSDENVSKGLPKAEPKMDIDNQLVEDLKEKLLQEKTE